jgi:hypothetical protein
MRKTRKPAKPVSADVNLDVTASMLEELVRQGLDQHYLAQRARRPPQL